MRLKLRSLSSGQITISMLLSHNNLFYFRLVNMLDITKVEEDPAWKIVKKIRRSFLFEHPHADCQVHDTLLSESKTLLSDENIEENINRVTKELKLNTSLTPDKNISFKTLETAGEMFTYLNNCPGLIPKYLRIIAHLFQNGTSREIIIGLKSIIKTSKNWAEKYKTIEMLSKFLETLRLKEYEKVQIITKGKCYTNATFDKCTKKIDLINEESLKNSGCFWYLSYLFKNIFHPRIPEA